MPQPAIVVYCNCSHYQVIPDEVRSAVLDALSESDIEFHAVADLCGLCANKDERLKQWASADSLKIIACFPRTVKWLFHAGGASLQGRDVKVFNMRNTPAEEIIKAVLDGHEKTTQKQEVEIKTDDEWVPWFPVIDYDRCVNCRQCFNFCLFGTYKLDDNGKVIVANPAGCKTNCPACARICPQQAIIFPKYETGPINGDEVADDGDKTAVDMSKLTNGDPMSALRGRGGNCPTIENLQKQLDIPADVLASLSPNDMKKISDKQKGFGDGK